MNWLDYVLVAIVGLSSGLALLRGLVREAMGLFVWAASLVIASRIWRWGSEALWHGSNGSQDVASSPLGDAGGFAGRLGAFLVLFIASSLAIRLLAMPITWRLHSFANGIGLSWANRLFGLAFGLARGVGVVLLGFLILQELNIPEPVWMSHSQLAPLTHRGASYLATWLPEDFPLPSDVWSILPTYDGDASTRWTPDEGAR